MENFTDELLESIKRDHNKLKTLKTALVKMQEFELGVKVREIEKEIFPESEEQKQAKVKAKEYRLLFQMVELDIPLEVGYLIVEACEVFRKKKGKFDIKDAAKLISDRNCLFN